MGKQTSKKDKESDERGPAFLGWEQTAKWLEIWGKTCPHESLCQGHVSEGMWCLGHTPPAILLEESKVGPCHMSLQNDLEVDSRFERKSR